MGQPSHRGEYPKDWATIAGEVKAAAGGQCVRCKAKHDPAIGYCLTVHHFDGDKANVAKWNLMALCQRCHLSVQARVDPAQGLIIHPSRWSMPYIAGMIEAGRTPRPPMYNLAKWIEEHGEWPDWAPKGST